MSSSHHIISTIAWHYHDGSVYRLPQSLAIVLSNLTLIVAGYKGHSLTCNGIYTAGLTMKRLILFFCALSLSVAHRTYRDRLPNGYNVPNPCKPGTIWEAVGHNDPLNGSHQHNPFGEVNKLAGNPLLNPYSMNLKTFWPVLALRVIEITRRLIGWNWYLGTFAYTEPRCLGTTALEDRKTSPLWNSVSSIVFLCLQMKVLCITSSESKTS